MAAPKKGKPEGPPIIVKKITVVGGGHHGGAWKVAYADFVTAMMAFFLLLWLLGATNEKQRKGIADHFTPTLVKLRQESAGSNGMLGGSSITDADNYPNRAGQTGNRTITIPRDTTGGPKEAADRMKQMQDKLAQKLVESRVPQRIAKQVRLIDTSEGIRIDLVDDADFAMFQLGTTVLTSDAAQLLKAIGSVIAPEPGAVSIRGHTDALPWRGGGPGRGDPPGAAAPGHCRGPLPQDRGRGRPRTADPRQPAGRAQSADLDPVDALILPCQTAGDACRLSAFPQCHPA